MVIALISLNNVPSWDIGGWEHQYIAINICQLISFLIVKIIKMTFVTQETDSA